VLHAVNVVNHAVVYCEPESPAVRAIPKLLKLLIARLKGRSNLTGPFSFLLWVSAQRLRRWRNPLVPNHDVISHSHAESGRVRDLTNVGITTEVSRDSSLGAAQRHLQCVLT
jgi:hypothetical protein